jgi:hypothetical protein
MTNREFYTAITNNETLTADLREFASGEIAKLDAKNDKRRNTQTKTQKENEELKLAILDILNEGAKVASDIGSALGVTTQKASALCTLLVKDGKVAVADIKVKSKGTVKQYSLAEVVD